MQAPDPTPTPTTTSLGDRAAVVLGCVLLGLVALVSKNTPSEASHGFDLLAAGMLALGAGLAVASRRYPATMAMLLLGVSFLWYLRYDSRLVDIPAIVAFHMLGRTGDRRRQLLVAGTSTTLLLFGAIDDLSDARLAVEGMAWAVAAILSGELMRNRRLLLDEYADRAARAEAERDAEAERRVAQERLRIARDLHDVLAHTVSVMTVQAGVAADAVEHDADRATVSSALSTLRATGKEAMAEVRATVAVLRGADGGADTAPSPTLDRVPELVDAARARGLEVELDVDLAGVEVETLVELTAYRVVQESLTNVARHADATRAAVRIESGPSGLMVEVVDDGRSPAQPGDGTGHDPDPGFGLRGMTERVEAAGGTLAYGPLPRRGWAVRAILPTRTTAAAVEEDRP